MFPNDLKNILIEATLFNLLQAVNRIKIHELQINVNQKKRKKSAICHHHVNVYVFPQISVLCSITDVSQKPPDPRNVLSRDAGK